MKNLSVIDWIAIVLVVVGGLNWALVGLFGFDLVAYLFGSVMIIANIVYVVVGLAAIWLAIISPSLGKK